MKRRNDEVPNSLGSPSASKQAKLSEDQTAPGSAPEGPEARIAALKAKLEAVKKQQEELHSISCTFRGLNFNFYEPNSNQLILTL